MKLLAKIIVGLFVLGAAGALVVGPMWTRWQEARKPNYRQATVTRGDVISKVNSTGTVKPILNVQVGSFASGPIKTVYVDFNDTVKAGQVLAEVDPLLYTAQRDQAKASLACASANLLQAKARRDQAKREWQRAQTLGPKNAISDTDYDLAKSTCDSAAANVAVCEATIEQNKGMLEMAETNLRYTTIKSPVDGVIIERKIDPGQTVAAQFQTPELFKVAPELDKRVHVFASVDEADIGLIRDAQERKQPAMFTVDAYPNDLFQGKVYQVRLNPTTTQNVVTYPVIVEASNSDLKLLPGMTANITFQIETHANVLRVPNAALRFYPKPEQAREEDRSLLEGDDLPTTDDAERTSDTQRSAQEKVEAARKRSRRHVWIVDGEFLKAMEIVTGLSDEKYSEILSGALQDGQSVVTGIIQKKP